MMFRPPHLELHCHYRVIEYKHVVTEIVKADSCEQGLSNPKSSAKTSLVSSQPFRLNP